VGRGKYLSKYNQRRRRAGTEVRAYDSDYEKGNDGSIPIWRPTDIIRRQGDILVRSKSFRKEGIKHGRKEERQDDLDTDRAGR
jgi:hypothetical protein